MFCQKCGTEMMDGSTFCAKCGAPATGGPSLQSVAAQNKSNRKLLIIIICVICVPLTLFFLGIFAAVLIPNIIRARDIAQFAGCTTALNMMVVAEESHMMSKNQYASNPDALAMYLMPECKTSDGSDCKGKVIKKMEETCKAGSVVIETNPDMTFYSIKGMAKTHSGCAICLTPMGKSPVSYGECSQDYNCLQQ
ncbi:MAG: zinc-ribbon domain-containing protein [bacterium]